MEINMKVNGKMIIKMVKEYIIGIVENLKELNMMENGKMMIEMVKEYSHLLMEINMMENGKMIR